MSVKTLMTAEEFERISDTIGSAELVRGEVVQLSPAGFEHGRIVANVAFLLEQWARKSRRGRVVAGEAGVIVETDPDTVRGADVAYISYARLPKEKRPTGFVSTPPELVVEVIGAERGWKETIDKAAEYLTMGIDRVWIIDPNSRRLHVFRPDAEPIVLAEGDRLTDDAILPGFSCTVQEFFED